MARGGLTGTQRRAKKEKEAERAAAAAVPPAAARVQATRAEETPEARSRTLEKHADDAKILSGAKQRWIGKISRFISDANHGSTDWDRAEVLGGRGSIDVQSDFKKKNGENIVHVVRFKTRNFHFVPGEEVQFVLGQHPFIWDEPWAEDVAPLAPPAKRLRR